jgi:hypothetical protein
VFTPASHVIRDSCGCALSRVYRLALIHVSLALVVLAVTLALLVYHARACFSQKLSKFSTWGNNNKQFLRYLLTP